MAIDNRTKKPSTISKLLIRFDELKQREQRLIMFAIPISILFGVFFGMVEMDINKAFTLKDRAKALQIQLSLSEQTSAQLIQQSSQDPNIAVEQQIEGLKNRLNKLNKDFAGEMSQLVSPQAMPVLLEALLDSAVGVELIEMTSKDPSLLDVQNLSEADKADARPIFRHTLQIKVEGDFFATRNFLAGAEQIGWKIYWQDLSYQVLDYPTAVTELSLFTLSTSEAFIGVN